MLGAIRHTTEIVIVDQSIFGFLLLNDMLGAIRHTSEIVIVDQLIFVFAAKRHAGGN